MDLCHIAALKDIQLENTEEIKAEENDDKSRYDIYPKAVFLQKSAESAGQCTHHHKDKGETEDKAKGDGLVNFVSDSMLAAGLPDGEYIAEEDGGVNIVTNGLSRLADGTINGSASTLLKGVQNAVKIDIPLESAVKMASYNPAVSLKIDHECGSIDIGKRADVFIAGEDLVPKAVFVQARRVK